MSRIILFLTALVIALTASKIYQIVRPLGVPEFQTDDYWGSGSPSAYTDNNEIKPQEIFYTETQLNKIRTRLNETINFLRPLEGTFDEYGINTVELQKILNYWKDSYLSKWDERQAFLNKFPHFITEIQG